MNVLSGGQAPTFCFKFDAYQEVSDAVVGKNALKAGFGREKFPIDFYLKNKK